MRGNAASVLATAATHRAVIRKSPYRLLESVSPGRRPAAVLSEAAPGSSTATGSSHGSRLERQSDTSDGGGGSSAVRQLGLIGLTNTENTCFMKSVLQCFSNTRAFHDYILRDEYSFDINTTSAMKGVLIKAFAALMCDLWKRLDEADRVLTTAPFKAQLQRFGPRFIGSQQQEAQEFLRYLLKGLHEEVNRITSRPTSITTDIDDSLNVNQKSMEAWRLFLHWRTPNSSICSWGS